MELLIFDIVVGMVKSQIWVYMPLFTRLMNVWLKNHATPIPCMQRLDLKWRLKSEIT